MTERWFSFFLFCLFLCVLCVCGAAWGIVYTTYDSAPNGVGRAVNVTMKFDPFASPIIGICEPITSITYQFNEQG